MFGYQLIKHVIYYVMINTHYIIRCN